ncbi:hypothetical protein [Actinokineospora sp. HUAS TT18]|uniref:hypothetical protein n=1 Tax=Actinokineospora sp. HUAS TT18 TaxID=3447451 RepID=UPI003F5251D6
MSVIATSATPSISLSFTREHDYFKARSGCARRWEKPNMAVARFQIYRSAATGVTWRFLSANNRSIGQAADTFDDASSCAVALRDLRDRLASASVIINREGPKQLWAWRIRIADQDLAVSSRRYHRRVQASYACRSFLELVAESPNSELPRLVHF